MHAHEMQTLHPKIFGRIPDLLLRFSSTIPLQYSSKRMDCASCPIYQNLIHPLQLFLHRKQVRPRNIAWGLIHTSPSSIGSLPIHYLSNPALQSVILPVYFQIHRISTYMCPRSTPSYAVTNLNR